LAGIIDHTAAVRAMRFGQLREPGRSDRERIGIVIADKLKKLEGVGGRLQVFVFDVGSSADRLYCGYANPDIWPWLKQNWGLPRNGFIEERERKPNSFAMLRA